MVSFFKKNIVEILFLYSSIFYILLLGTNSLFNFIGMNNSLDSIVLYGIYFVLMVLSFFKIIRKMDSLKIFVLLFLVAFILYGLIVNYSDYTIRSAKSCFLTAVPFIFVGFSLDFKRIEKPLRFFVLLAFLSGFFHLLPGFIGSSDLFRSHDMTAAYSILPVSLLALYFLFYKKGFAWKLISIGLGIEVFLFGTRGPILIFIIAVLINFVNVCLIKKNKFLIIVVVSILALFIFSGQAVPLLELINSFLLEKGINNVALNYLLTDSFNMSNGRSELTELLFKEMGFNIFGLGIFSDRVILQGSYSHNIFTEFICDFGFILGPIFISIILFVSIKMIWKVRKNYFLFILISMIVLMVFGQNLVSGSYLENEFFFILIGLFFNKNFNYLINKKTRGKNVLLHAV